MTTASEVATRPDHLQVQLNRSIRHRLFDAQADDLWSAVCHYKIGSLHADDLIAIVQDRLEGMCALRGDSPVDDACTFAARALYEGLLEEGNLVTDEQIEEVVDTIFARLHRDIEEDLVPPESTSDGGGGEAREGPVARGRWLVTRITDHGSLVTDRATSTPTERLARKLLFRIRKRNPKSKTLDRIPKYEITNSKKGL